MPLRSLKLTLFSPSGQYLENPGEAEDALNHLVALRVAFTTFARHQQVKIAHGLTSAPQRARGRDLLHAGNALKQLCHLVRDLVGDVDQKAAGKLAVALNGLEDFLL